MSHWISVYVAAGVYIYIHCHPQTDCFVLSELFSVARHAGRSKPGSKPVQLYVRQGLGPVGHMRERQRQRENYPSGAQKSTKLYQQ